VDHNRHFVPSYIVRAIFLARCLFRTPRVKMNYTVIVHIPLFFSPLPKIACCLPLHLQIYKYKFCFGRFRYDQRDKSQGIATARTRQFEEINSQMQAGVVKEADVLIGSAVVRFDMCDGFEMFCVPCPSTIFPCMCFCVFFLSL
jgi:hypothetical protein